MLEISLDINQNHTRPVFTLYNVSALLDPGAELPIFGISEEAVKIKFNGVRIGQVGISGFGGEQKETPYTLYLIPEFQIKEMTYKNIPVAVGETSKVNVDLVLGATMFGAGTKYTIDTATDIICIKYSDKAAEKGCLWKKNKKNEWKVLSFKNNNWILE